MFGLSVRLFRVFGIDIKIDLSWALIAVFIAWMLAQGVFPQLYEGFAPAAYWWMALAAILGLGASIILHELSHSLVAKAFGLPLHGITLFIFGGVAELEREPANPFSEFVMAVAGPLASVGLAIFFGWAAEVSGAASPAASVFAYLALINWVLAIFNMIPALPLDGGRALRAVVWAIRRDYAAATRLASNAGVVVAWALILLGVVWAALGQFVAALWWVLIGLFMRSAAKSALVHEQMTRLFRDAPVRDFMTRDPVCVPPELTLRTFVDEYVYTHHFDLFPVVRTGELLGSIGLKETKSVPRARWDATRVEQVMTPLSEINTIDAGVDALDALAMMHRGKISRLLVVEGGKLVGVIALKDLLELLALKMSLDGRR